MVTAGIIALCFFLFGFIVLLIHAVGLSLPLLARQVFNLRGLAISALVAGILLMAVRQLVRSEPAMPGDSRSAPVNP